MHEPSTRPRSSPLMICIGLLMLGTIFFGIFPHLALDFARQSFLALG